MALKSTVTTRVVFGLLMGASLIGLLIGEGWAASRDYFFMDGRYRGLFFAIIVGVVGCCGAVELSRLLGVKGVKVPLILVIAAILAAVLSPLWSKSGRGLEDMATVILGYLLLAGIYQGVKIGVTDTIVNLGGGCFMIIYLGLGCYFLTALRLLGANADTIIGQSGWILLFLATVKSADIGAYFTGRSVGRRKWVPSISPAKTWEGFFGGLALATITATAISGYFGILCWTSAVLFGILVAICGQLGDLLESMLKRDAQLKDSGSLIPEFGGFLDLIDSPVAAAPIAYLYIKCLV